MRLVAFARCAVVSLVFTAVACRGTTTPLNPSPGVGGGGGQPPPASVTVSRLENGGPDSVPPGEAVQLCTGYSGTLNGGFEVVRFASPWHYGLDQVERVASCGSERHQFVLSR